MCDNVRKYCYLKEFVIGKIKFMKQTLYRSKINRITTKYSV